MGNLLNCRMRESVEMKLRSRKQKRDNLLKSEERGSVSRLRCLNCGQLIFVNAGGEPPEVCQYCDDMTTWQALGD